MEIHHLSYRNSTIAWYRFGTGPRLVLCFHGYGEEAGSFKFLGTIAGNEFSFYALDLPFHGKTEWKEGYDFTSKDLQNIITGILNEHAASGRSRQVNTDSSNPVTKISLLGFSLGGRVALSLYQSAPELFDRLVLLAPDGLKVNAWYWLATQTWAGNRLFGFTMKHPGWFFGLLKVLNAVGLVNTSIFKFVKFYIGDKEARRLLYARWTTLRLLRPSVPKIRSLAKENKTAVRLVYGIHDRIILSSVGEKFRKGIEGYCHISVIHSGHQVLHEKHQDEILATLAKA